MENGLKEKIQIDLTQAIKERNGVKINALRLVKSAITNAESEGSRHVLSDEEILSLISKQIKQREESVEMYNSAGRKELAENELEEINVLKDYLPSKLNQEEAEEAIKAAILELGISSKKEKGKLISWLRTKFGVRMDIKSCIPIIDSLLK